MSEVEFDQNQFGSREFGSTSPLIGLLMRWGVKSETSANKILVGIAVLAVVLTGVVLVRQWSGKKVPVPVMLPNEEFITEEF